MDQVNDARVAYVAIAGAYLTRKLGQQRPRYVDDAGGTVVAIATA